MQQQYQPYGQQALMPHPGKRIVPQPIKSFAYAYLAIRGLMLVLLVLFVVTGSRILNDGGEGEAVVAVMLGMSIFVLLWSAYVLTAGIMSLRGMLAGPIMGLVDAGGFLFLYILGTGFALATGKGGDTLFGFIIAGINAALVIMAIRAIRRRNDGRFVPQLHPAYGIPPQAYAASQPPGVPVVAPAPATLSQPQAVARILGIAVSADGLSSESRLERARKAAEKLLGAGHESVIQRELAKPPEIGDLESDLRPLIMALATTPNSVLNRNLARAARYVVEENGEVDPLAEEFLQTLQRLLGVQPGPA
jgi:hypothetical protein